MRTSPWSVVVLAVVLAAPALAQAEPTWAGLFAQGEVKLRLVPSTTGFTGVVEVRGQRYDARGTVSDGKLAGTFVADGADYDFTVYADGADAVVLVSDGVKRRLARRKPTNPLVGEAPAVQTGAPAATAHIRAGQRYIYVMQGGVQMSWTVKEVRPDLVRYEMQSYMDMGQGLQAIGDPTPSEFPLLVVAPGDRQAPAAPPPAGTTIARESVTISGVTFDCMVATTGETKSWISMAGDAATFPGCIKSAQGGVPVMELVRVEQP